MRNALMMMAVVAPEYDKTAVDSQPSHMLLA
jgi:hypothetical protein